MTDRITAAIHHGIERLVYAAGHWVTFLLTTAGCFFWWGSDPDFDLLKAVSALAIWLSVAILHSTQAKDEAMHLKMDTLVAAIDAADNRVIGVERADTAPEPQDLRVELERSLGIEGE